MLENIKIILDIKDDSFDELITLYIQKYTDVVLAYCKLKNLNKALESFIEDKIVTCLSSKVKANGTGAIENNGEIKAITRGDTKIEYNVGSNGVEVSSSKGCKGAILTDEDRQYLSSFIARGMRLL